MATILVELFDWNIRWQGDSIHGGLTMHVCGSSRYVALYRLTNFDGSEAESSFRKLGLNHLDVVVDDLDATECSYWMCVFARAPYTLYCKRTNIFGKAMIIDGVFKTLDPMLKTFMVDANGDPQDYYGKLESAEGIDHIWQDLRSIDAKSSGLLTHISVMFVVLGFLASGVENLLLRSLLTAEFIAYIFAAMVLLRCLDMTGPPLNDLPEDTAGLRAIQAREALLRKTIYVRVLRLVYVLTALLIPIVGFKLLA